jgi:hypothetical protein
LPRQTQAPNHRTDTTPAGQRPGPASPAGHQPGGGAEHQPGRPTERPGYRAPRRRGRALAGIVGGRHAPDAGAGRGTGHRSAPRRMPARREAGRWPGHPGHRSTPRTRSRATHHAERSPGHPRSSVNATHQIPGQTPGRALAGPPRAVGGRHAPDAGRGRALGRAASGHRSAPCAGCRARRQAGRWPGSPRSSVDATHQIPGQTPRRAIAEAPGRRSAPRTGHRARRQAGSWAGRPRVVARRRAPEAGPDATPGCGRDAPDRRWARRAPDAWRGRVLGGAPRDVGWCRARRRPGGAARVVGWRRAPDAGGAGPGCRMESSGGAERPDEVPVERRGGCWMGAGAALQLRVGRDAGGGSSDRRVLARAGCMASVLGLGEVPGRRAGGASRVPALVWCS